MASPQLSIRLPQAVMDRLDARSRLTGRTRSETAQTLIDEGLRMAAHPGIVFRDGPAGRRPGLADGPDVWEVARVFDGQVDVTDDLIRRSHELTGLSPRQLRIVARYYAEYRDEVDEWISIVDAIADEHTYAVELEPELSHP